MRDRVRWNYDPRELRDEGCPLIGWNMMPYADCEHYIERSSFKGEVAVHGMMIFDLRISGSSEFNRTVRNVHAHQMWQVSFEALISQTNTGAHIEHPQATKISKLVPNRAQ